MKLEKGIEKINKELDKTIASLQKEYNEAQEKAQKEVQNIDAGLQKLAVKLQKKEQDAMEQMNDDITKLIKEADAELSQ